MSIASGLWGDGKVFIRDALRMVSRGVSIDVQLDDESDSGVSFGGEFDLEFELGKNPDWVTPVDVTGTRETGDGGEICRGEGSYGSEGFFARMDEKGGLIWVMYFEESNPFVGVSLIEGEAIFRSTSGVTVVIDIGNPGEGG
ncbi:hypothetical protein [Streptomyces sp. ST2-7A]|uniref:hypothetical protein n=1 Tax=Streptomyces sp. ST2-7A TaxID=2907214 RepID=UPI001F26EBE1|nr:hypothetical protein [Streptomyces sp. ST2-7A]MCE7082187.1 hypothetical protein [Streptomyces sp. ST2-7A]